MADTPISVRFDDKLMLQIDAKVKSGATNRSAVVREAVERYFDDEEKQYRRIPDAVKSQVDFLVQIVLTGSPGNDWALVKEEVMRLWNALQS